MKNETTPDKKLLNWYVPTAEFYSQVIDSLEDYSIFTMDEHLIINSWSSGSAKIFGYETRDIVGRHFSIIFSEEDKKEGVPKREIETANKEGRATDNRWHVKKDKSRFFASGLVFPLTGLKGEKMGYVKILRDLTEIKKTEEAAAKYLAELEELNTHNGQRGRKPG